MYFRSLLIFPLLSCFLVAAEIDFVDLPERDVRLTAPAGWVVKERHTEIGIYPPDQPSKGLPRRIHLSTQDEAGDTIQDIVNRVFDNATEREKKRRPGSEDYLRKDVTPVRTQSGVDGLRAIFYDVPQGDDTQEPHFSIVYYFFRDSRGGHFRVCSHVYGNQETFRRFEHAILNGLQIGQN